jgi:hypothetical protein
LQYHVTTYGPDSTLAQHDARFAATPQVIFYGIERSFSLLEGHRFDESHLDPRHEFNHTMPSLHKSLAYGMRRLYAREGKRLHQGISPRRYCHQGFPQYLIQEMFKPKAVAGVRENDIVALQALQALQRLRSTTADPRSQTCRRRHHTTDLPGTHPRSFRGRWKTDNKR